MEKSVSLGSVLDNRVQSKLLYIIEYIIEAVNYELRTKSIARTG